MPETCKAGVLSIYLCPDFPGEVSEWLKEHAWKVCIRETVSRVRIPLSPPAPAKFGRTRLAFFVRYLFHQSFVQWEASADASTQQTVYLNFALVILLFVAPFFRQSIHRLRAFFPSEIRILIEPFKGCPSVKAMTIRGCRFFCHLLTKLHQYTS